MHEYRFYKRILKYVLSDETDELQKRKNLNRPLKRWNGEKMKKKVISILLAGVMAVAMLAGCGGSDNADAGINTETRINTEASVGEENAAGNFDVNELISVYSREDGSGTRGAFVELFGIEQKNAEGVKVDYTTVEAIITNSTDVMMTSVAGDAYGIGYISLGSLNDTVKAVKIDGVEATIENIKAGTYTVARPFNIATKSEVSEMAQDFINYIMSAEGQAIIEGKGYITVAGEERFVSNNAAGKIVVGGSSSVSPVMEKLIEGYLAVNANAEIELNTSDSSTGMSQTAEGVVDIGMASRDIKSSELELGLVGTTIAMDGIAVIVNHENPMDNLTAEAVKNIFMGEACEWSEVTK